ncbi:MAG: hypothetical protein J6O61_06770 [Butyrivibrio sp.]|nr:hypothetical protein [Butyrivibrio sp.]
MEVDMADIKPISDNEIIENKNEIVKTSEELLLEVRNESIPKDKSIAMPIAELSTLGAGVSSLIPAFNTVTQTTTMNVAGLYKLANASVGDTLKIAKNGNFWGAFKTAGGGSKFAQLAAADPISATSSIAMKANPAILMMSVALFSIEKELGTISETTKQILSYLEIEKESKIEGDLETLNGIISKYKHNWDNDLFIASNHKMVCDIQRTARENMISFQKSVDEVLNTKKFVVAKGQVNDVLNNLQKKFQYYRLSLYTFGLASMTEVMLSGNFKEENISASVIEIRKNSDQYRELFSKCSVFLEKLSNGSIEVNLLKGIGIAGNAVGKFIGNIPKIKDGQVDEFLQEKGGKLRNTATDISKETIELFSKVSDPNTGIFMRKMAEMIQIYDKTTEICFDKDNIYLIAG